MEIKPHIQIIALNANTWTEIPADRAGSILMQLRENDIDFYLAENITPGSTYYTIKAGSALAMDVSVQTSSGLYAKAQSGAPTLEMIWLKQE